MASLMETLIDVLHRESDLYEELIEVAQRKTPVIISGDLQALADITGQEQERVDLIAAADRDRDIAMKDMANVLSRDHKSLKLTDIVNMLDKRPKEQAALARERDRLVEVAGRLKRVNDQNQELLQSSLEMTEFEMNIIQASRRAPETANYSRLGASAGARYGMESGSFNAGA